MPTDGSSSNQSGGPFTTTQWSLVLAAADSEDPGSRQALAALCEAYWYPVYVLVRHSRRDPEQARDLTQGFFVELLDRSLLKVADPDRGRFRSFLRTALRHYLSHERREASALKRGGGRPLLSIDFDDAESRWKHEPVETTTPEKLFEKRWAHVLLTRALARLRSDMGGTEEKNERLRRLLPFLTDQNPQEKYSDVAAALDMTGAAVKKAVQRLRLRFGDLLRVEVSQTVHEAEEIEDEIRHLFTVLGS
jgi:RNA polymerase sigma-70 factor (ECF subfamily)